MGYTAKDVRQVAEQEIGYLEKETNSQLDDKTANAGDGNYTKYARDLHAAGYYQASKQGYAWCDMWHDWIHYIAAGKNRALAEAVTCQTGPYGAGCEWSAKYYKAKGRFDQTPIVGDQVFFNKFAHTGWLAEIVGGKLRVIEGNTSNKVAWREYAIGDPCIDGFGHPIYDDDTADIPATPVKLTGEVSTYSKAFLQKMYSHLKKLGYSDIGIYVMLANANAESACKSNNLQNTGNTELTMSDAEYTAAVDSGKYTKFVDDGHGYGLFQWTWWSRKSELLDFAQSGKNTIGDWEMQLDFADMELKQGYRSLYNMLRTDDADMKLVCDEFMVKFENPYDKSDDAKDRRYKFALDIKALLEGKDDVEPTVPESSVTPPSTGDDEEVYIVQSRDTLTKIAALYGTTYRVLADYNNIKNPNLIYVNQKIRIPAEFSKGEKDTTVKENSKVQIKAESVYGGLSKTRGKEVPPWVQKRTLTVVRFATHKGVREALLKEINSWVAVDSLTVV